MMKKEETRIKSQEKTLTLNGRCDYRIINELKTNNLPIFQFSNLTTIQQLPLLPTSPASFPTPASPTPLSDHFLSNGLR
jgi:hypothetical protein